VSDAGALDEIELTPAGAAARVRDETALGSRRWTAGDVEGALDAYIRALGLALQLGPGPTEQVLAAVLAAAATAPGGGAAEVPDALSTLGPALVDLVDRVQAAGALPDTPVMAAWASVAAEIGTLIGTAGIACALPAARRSGLLTQARSRAEMLDEATGGLFGLVDWVAGFT
jgi:hypothetical protein